MSRKTRSCERTVIGRVVEVWVRAEGVMLEAVEAMQRQWEGRQEVVVKASVYREAV